MTSAWQQAGQWRPGSCSGVHTAQEWRCWPREPWGKEEMWAAVSTGTPHTWVFTEALHAPSLICLSPSSTCPHTDWPWAFTVSHCLKLLTGNIFSKEHRTHMQKRHLGERAGCLGSSSSLGCSSERRPSKEGWFLVPAVWPTSWEGHLTVLASVSPSITRRIQSLPKSHHEFLQILA